MKTLIVFVVVENSQGEKEILAYPMSVLQEAYDNGDHLVEAEAKAEKEGYEAITSFDSMDMAGKQLFGRAPVYGEKEQYLASIEGPVHATAKDKLLNDAADLMEAHLVHGDISEEAFTQMTHQCCDATGNLPDATKV